MGLLLPAGVSGSPRQLRQLSARNIGHQAALREMANQLVGILHGCLTTHTTYDETTAGSHHLTTAA